MTAAEARESAETDSGARLAAAIRKEIEKAPPLSQEQRDRLALLLAKPRRRTA